MDWRLRAGVQGWFVGQRSLQQYQVCELGRNQKEYNLLHALFSFIYQFTVALIASKGQRVASAMSNCYTNASTDCSHVAYHQRWHTRKYDQWFQIVFRDIDVAKESNVAA